MLLWNEGTYDDPSSGASATPVPFDGREGRVVASSNIADQNGRGSITFEGQVFSYKCLKATAYGLDVPIITLPSGDEFLRVSVLQHPTDPLLFALMFEDPYWGRDVGGNKDGWAPATEFEAEDSVIFRMGWAAGAIIIKSAGVLQPLDWVDQRFTWGTDDGTYEGPDVPAFPNTTWGNQPTGMYRTNAESIVEKIYPDGSTEPVIFPRGWGARGQRIEDLWTSAPTPERTLAQVRCWYWQESVEVIENTDVELDLASVSLTVTGDADSDVALYLEDGTNTNQFSLGAGGSQVVTGLKPGVYVASNWDPLDITKGTPRQSIDLPESGDSGALAFPALTQVAVGTAAGVIYEYGATGLPGATIWASIQTMGPSEIVALAVTGGGGAWGPVDTTEEVYEWLAVDTPQGAIRSNPVERMWWDGAVGARWFVSRDDLGSPEGVIPWDNHRNLPAELTAFIQNDQTGTTYKTFRKGNGYSSEPMPGWRHDGGLVVPASRYTYTLREASFSQVIGSLSPDDFNAWKAGGDPFVAGTMGSVYEAELGGKQLGPVIEANRDVEVTDSLEVPWLYGIEFGKWARQPIEWRITSEEAGTDERMLVFTDAACDFCGGMVWREPDTPVFRRGFCASCRIAGFIVDARGHGQSFALGTMSDWRTKVVITKGNGEVTKIDIDGWPRPEEYARTPAYEITFNGLTRIKAKHIVLWTSDPGQAPLSVIPSGAIGQYLMEDAGPTTVVDSASSPANGTAGGNVTFGISGQVSNAIDLDDADGTGQVTIGTAGKLNITEATGITVSGWVKPDGAAEVGFIFSRFDLVSGTGYALRWAGDTNQLAWHHGSGGGVTIDLSDAVFTDDGTWVHVASTVDTGGNGIFYRAGVAAGTFSGVAITGAADDVAMIGGHEFGGAESARFDGGVDQLRIYPSALSAGDIALLAAEV